MLTGPQFLPSEKTVQRAVFLLHGFGSNGDDLLGLVAPLEAALPEAERGVTAYFAPHGLLELDFGGYAWFSDNNWTFRDRAGISAAADALWAYIEAQLALVGLGAEAAVVLGFSQGAMTALFAAPRWPEAVGGVIAHSGRMFWAEELVDKACQRPPVLVLHGRDDDVVVARDGAAAAVGLRDLGFGVWHEEFSGLGHGIDGRSLVAIARFMSKDLK